ncbi:MAG: putative nucleic-acid-binding protein containing a Zn-ribbon [Halorubrum sp. J07HR59]|nr:MAG: putative nucleic-acid-binding protein containing a Zn-ribbon [Halorubrum sp. J07HR59]
MSSTVTHDDWVEALADGEGFYLQCPDGHGSLPPRRVCPTCGASLSKTPLPRTGTVETYTTVHVASPEFAEDTPYLTVIATFDSVRLTGVMLETAPEAVSSGCDVEPLVVQTDTTGDRTIGFELR